MKLSALGCQNRISYTGNLETNNTQKHAEPKRNETVKKAVKYTALAVAGLTALALVADKGKSLGKLFKNLGKNTGKQTGEKVEEIIPEVLDFDTVWGPKITARKKTKIQPPKTVVINARGNVLGERREMGSAYDFINNMRKSSEKSKCERVMDAVIDFIDDFGWMI